MRGTLVTMNPKRGFCHAQATDGRSVFIHRDDLNVVLDDCWKGDVVEFDIELTPQGPRGRDVVWVERPEPPRETAVPFEGRVVTVLHERQICFVRPDTDSSHGHKSPHDIVCHVAGFADQDATGSLTFDQLEVGDRLRGRLGITDRGRRGFDVELA